MNLLASLRNQTILAICLGPSLGGCLGMTTQPADSSPTPEPVGPVEPAPALVSSIERCANGAPQGLYVSGSIDPALAPEDTTVWVRAVGNGLVEPSQVATDIFLVARASDGVFAVACPKGLFDNTWYPWMVAVADANANGRCDEGDLVSFTQMYAWGMGDDLALEVSATYDPIDDHFDVGWSTYEVANAAFTREPHLTGGGSICDAFPTE